MKPQATPSKTLKTAAGAAAIAAAGAWIYAPVLRGDWLWDDGEGILRNPALRDWAGLGGIWRGASGPDYFPLKTSVQWLQWHLWHDQVLGYHLTNVGLHLFSALLVWRLAGRLGLGGVAAWLAGLLFAVHPLAVESVAWMSELKNTLSLPLLLAALITYLAYDRGGGLGAYFGALACFVLAMLAKTSVALFPAILLLQAWWRRGRIGRRDLKAAAPFFGVALVLGLVTVAFQARRVTANLPMPSLGLGARTAGAGEAILFYLGKCLWPAHLSPIYPGPAAGQVPILRWAPWLGIALAALWFWSRRATWGRHALFGLGSFALNLAPVLGWIPMAFQRIAPVSDHLCYVALVSVAILAAASLRSLRRFAPAGALGLAAAAAVLACAEASRGYARQFTSEEALWTFTLARNPDAWLAHNNLGIVYARTGRIGPAIAEGEAAVRLRPSFPEARSNLGLALTSAGRLPEAIAELDAAVRLAPGLPGARLNLGRALLLAGRLPEALAQFEAALRLDPASPEARADLGVAHNNLANAFARAGRFAEAIEEFRRALAFNPGNPGTHRNLGFALQSLGRDEEAQAEFATAQRLGGRL